MQVFLRKRPLSEKEQQVRAEYDALTVIPRKPYSNEVVLHNCQFQADLKTPFITHIHYGFDCVFPEDVSNELVYAQTAQPLVQIAINGGMATMFMFGQTGHGLASVGEGLFQEFLYIEEFLDPWFQRWVVVGQSHIISHYINIVHTLDS